jgi:hypothetical protein
MTRYILLISLTILSHIFYSQNVGFLGKKTTIETTIGISPSSIKSMADATDITNTTGVTDAPGATGFYIPMRHRIQLGRSFGRKFGMSAEFSHAYPSSGFEKSQYQENSFWATGLNLNFFSKGSIAPFGKYFSVYLKYNVGTSKEFTYSQNGITKQEQLEINFMTTGMSFNSMTFLSKKQPLYFKYSFKVGIPFNTNMEINGRTLGENKASDIRANDYKTYHLRHDYFELNLGLGYIF